MSEEEIEYLDEDADIVQQCVQNVSLTQKQLVETVTPQTPLLVERQPVSKKKKRKIEEDDSDYDPRENIVLPPPNRNKKKKYNPMMPKPAVPKTSTSLPSQKVQYRQTKKVIPSTVPLHTRRKMTIGIPDYDDPLCLPVRAIIRNAIDKKKLKSWNDACISHLKHADKVLKPEKGVTKGSSRMVVLRKVLNKDTGKYEIAVWTKTCVENENGAKKSQNFQSILPKFSERTVLNVDATSRKPKKYRHVDEVILTKETYKNEDTLVVYKTNEHLSASYAMTIQNSSEDKDGEESPRKYLREVSCCGMCAACYQLSYRNVSRKENNLAVVCPVCSRTFVSLYNLLTHVRSHSSDDVKMYKKEFSKLLAQVVGYHYKCRLCQEQCDSIRNLRLHVATHKGNKTFVCEVGNHATT
ncbi:myoneurin isoform X2 [Amyelois transitella]|uniref:myoneurin isoform X2 n=1 Tax=Amyelois transitella TaxID=680683 RepID=UPI0029901511|nr:myoneurin isoform X2 [Amyelois transitella]